VALIGDSHYKTERQIVFFPQAKLAGIGLLEQSIENWRFLRFAEALSFGICEFLRKNTKLWTMVVAGL
jgi:hypothetical protein